MSRHKNTKKFPHLKQSVRIPIPVNSTSKFFSKLIPPLYPRCFPDHIRPAFPSYIQVVSLLPSDLRPTVSENGDLLTKLNFQGSAVSKKPDSLTE